MGLEGRRVGTQGKPDDRADQNVGTFEDYANTMLANDERRKGFAVYENTITGLYEACKPEILGKPIVRSECRTADERLIPMWNSGKRLNSAGASRATS